MKAALHAGDLIDGIQSPQVEFELLARRQLYSHQVRVRRDGDFQPAISVGSRLEPTILHFDLAANVSHGLVERHELDPHFLRHALPTETMPVLMRFADFL